MNKVLTYAALFVILLCPIVFLAGVFAPQVLSFLDPVVCPDGYTLDKAVGTYLDEVGNEGTSVDMVCVSPAGESVDVTPAMLGILFGIVVLAGVLFFLGNKPVRVTEN
jgi:hypothetical protein